MSSCPDCGETGAFREVGDEGGIEECDACGYWSYSPPTPSVVKEKEQEQKERVRESGRERCLEREREFRDE